MDCFDGFTIDVMLPDVGPDGHLGLENLTFNVPGSNLIECLDNFTNLIRENNPPAPMMVCISPVVSSFEDYIERVALRETVVPDNVSDLLGIPDLDDEIDLYRNEDER